MTASPITLNVCPRCGQELPPDAQLACPYCGALVHGAALERLAAEAKSKAQRNPAAAIACWQQCLPLLPERSQQYRAVQSEIQRLRAIPESTAPQLGAVRPSAVSDTWQKGIAKTGISMLISIAIYTYLWDWQTAVGFVLLIFVHEMGHVVANIMYDMPASAPVFIPFLGAVINLRKMPPNARVEAIVGIAGPIAGTIGALGCFAWYLTTQSQLALELSWFGFSINLFNLLPVPPLDGGRVAAAISPWIWILGLAGMGLMIVADLEAHRQVGIFVLVLIFALPRIVRTLKPRGRAGPYYRIGRVAPLVIGAVYLALLGLLLGLRMYAERHLSNGMI